MKAFKSVLFLILFLSFALPGWGGNTYYISSAIGDNAYSSAQAQNPAYPWADHPWNNVSGHRPAYTAAAGDIFIMRRGDTWYNQAWSANHAGSVGSIITTTSNSSFYASSSSDVYPIVSAAYDPSALSWSGSGGTYSCVVAQPYVVVYQGLMLNQDATPANHTPTVHCWGYDTNTLYINTGEGSTPDSTIRIGQNTAVTCYTNSDGYLAFDHVIFEATNNATGSIVYCNSTPVTFDHVTVRYLLYNGLYANGNTGGSYTSCEIYNTNWPIYTGISTATVKALYIRNASGETVSNCTLHDIYTPQGSEVGAAANIYNEAGITINNSTFYNLGRNLPYGGNGNGVAIKLEGTTGTATIKYNLIHDVYEPILDFSSGTGSGGSTIEYNVLYNYVVNGINISGNPVTADNVYNNTIKHEPWATNSPACTGHGIALQSSAIVSNFGNNNIYVNPSATSLNGGKYECQGICIAGSYNGVKTDYNNVYVATPSYAAVGLIMSTSYQTMAQWKTAVQADVKITDLAGVAGKAEAHSISSDPKFKSSTDYHLLGSSPCINTGTNLGATYQLDYDSVNQNLWGVPDPASPGNKKWEIGAYVYPHNSSGRLRDLLLLLRHH